MTATRDGLVDEVMLRVESLLSIQRRAFCAEPLPREVSLPQLYVLMTLHELGPMTVSTLAHLLKISNPSASSLIDRMEQHGLVDRTRDIVDRRVVNVTASDDGRRTVEALTGMRREGMHRLLARMTDAEMEDVIRAIEAIERASVRLEPVARAGGKT